MLPSTISASIIPITAPSFTKEELASWLQLQSSGKLTGNDVYLHVRRKLEERYITLVTNFFDQLTFDSSQQSIAILSIGAGFCSIEESVFKTLFAKKYPRIRVIFVGTDIDPDAMEFEATALREAGKLPPDRKRVVANAAKVDELTKKLTEQKLPLAYDLIICNHPEYGVNTTSAFIQILLNTVFAFAKPTAYIFATHYALEEEFQHTKFYLQNLAGHTPLGDYHIVNAQDVREVIVKKSPSDPHKDSHKQWLGSYKYSCLFKRALSWQPFGCPCYWDLYNNYGGDQDTNLQTKVRVPVKQYLYLVPYPTFLAAAKMLERYFIKSNLVPIVITNNKAIASLGPPVPDTPNPTIWESYGKNIVEGVEILQEALYTNGLRSIQLVIVEDIRLELLNGIINLLTRCASFIDMQGLILMTFRGQPPIERLQSSSLKNNYGIVAGYRPNINSIYALLLRRIK